VVTAPAFTQQDVEKAIAAAQAKNLTITRVDVNRHTGLISIITTPTQEAPPPPPDEIGAWLDRHSDEGRPPRRLQK
jgi:hypothetical protein